MAYRQLPGQASSPDREPERVTPVPEHYHGVNFPYRGTEQHGVAVPDDAKYDTREFQYPEMHEVDPEDALPEPDPILVRVVQDHARELLDWRAVRVPVSTNPVLLVGKNRARRSLRIRNTDATNAIYIGPDSSVSAFSGYKIPANTEPQPFVTTEEIWATTGDVTTVETALLFEFAVEL